MIRSDGGGGQWAVCRLTVVCAFVCCSDRALAFNVGLRFFARPLAMSDDLSALSARVGAALKAAGQAVATAESCTGGGIAEVLTRIAGSSAWFECGWVTYSNRAKQDDLRVPETLLATHGAVSEPVVRAMAEGARLRAGTDWALAVSGIAGPDGGSPGKPVGTVWLAWAGPAGTCTEHGLFAGDRAAVRYRTVERALCGLLEQMGVASR